MKVPAHISLIVETLGEEDAERFLLEFGGAELHVPERPTRRSELVQEMGLEVATKLASIRDRLPARIPTAKPWLAKRFAQKGFTRAKIARKLHVTDVTIRAYLDPSERPDPPPKHDPRQQTLL